MKRDGFAAGIELKCPSCELEDWVSINDLRTSVECHLCGHDYNVLPLLRDRDWSYVTSGLFRKYENQEGAAPVALLLQQLDSNANDGLCAFSTCMNLAYEGRKQETDFVWILDGSYGAPEFVIGECKSLGEIEQNDADNLLAVSSKLGALNVDVFVLFAKLDDFKPAEIAVCRSIHSKMPNRVVMLGRRDLEPYRIPLERSDYGMSAMERLAAKTARQYFPRPQT